MAHDVAFQLWTRIVCPRNPGVGAWAYLVRHTADGTESCGAGGVSYSTNNALELLAIVKGLESLEPSSNVELMLASAYVGRGLRQFIKKWKARNWRRREGKKWVYMKNVGLWQELDRLTTEHWMHDLFVNAHSKIPEITRCDKLADAALKQYRQSLETDAPC
jgi:ribonuclease HI